MLLFRHKLTYTRDSLLNLDCTNGNKHSLHSGPFQYVAVIRQLVVVACMASSTLVFSGLVSSKVGSIAGRRSQSSIAPFSDVACCGGSIARAINATSRDALTSTTWRDRRMADSSQ